MAAAIHFINSLPGRFCGGLFGRVACSTRCEKSGVRLSRTRADMYAACQVSDQGLRLPYFMQRKWRMCQPFSWLSQIHCRPYQVRPAAVPPLRNASHSCSNQPVMTACEMRNQNSKGAWHDALHLSVICGCVDQVQPIIALYLFRANCISTPCYAALVYSCTVPAACPGMTPGCLLSPMWITFTCTIGSHSPKPVCLTKVSCVEAVPASCLNVCMLHLGHMSSSDEVVSDLNVNLHCFWLV